MNVSRRQRLAVILATLLIVAACASQIPFALEESAAPIDLKVYRDAANAGADIYEVSPDESLILIRVGRSGSMARLGHDHVVASADLEGLVAVHTDLGSSFAAIAMPLKNLIVDDQTYRERLGLDSTPSESDIAGTYTNMQRVLEADVWPWTVVKVELSNVDSKPLLGKVSVSMHGVTRSYAVPLELDVNAGLLTVDGSFSIKQTEFGMTPFSALGGLLRVADELEIQFEVTAKRR